MKSFLNTLVFLSLSKNSQIDSANSCSNASLRSHDLAKNGKSRIENVSEKLSDSGVELAEVSFPDLLFTLVLRSAHSACSRTGKEAL
jgi:hypothetical protein